MRQSDVFSNRFFIFSQSVRFGIDRIVNHLRCVVSREQLVSSVLCVAVKHHDDHDEEREDTERDQDYSNSTEMLVDVLRKRLKLQENGKFSTQTHYRSLTYLFAGFVRYRVDGDTHHAIGIVTRWTVLGTGDLCR